MELVNRDIYGGSASIYFTLVVDVALTSPPGIVNCYVDPDIVPSGFAEDVIYILGT
jgi:hypothetical protein